MSLESEECRSNQKTLFDLSTWSHPDFYPSKIFARGGIAIFCTATNFCTATKYSDASVGVSGGDHSWQTNERLPKSDFSDIWI